MDSSTRRGLIGAGTCTVLGFVLGVVFTAASSLEYASRESRGLEPGPIPDVILLGQALGGLLVVAGAVWALWLAVTVLRSTRAPRGR